MGISTIIACVALWLGRVQPVDAAAVAGAAYACVGDCDASGSVGVDELVRLVHIVLGTASPEDCVSADANGDGSVAIDDIIAAVKSSLHGCGDARSQQVDGIVGASDTGPAAAVLISQDGRVVNRKVSGLADVETGAPASADSVFLVASVSKPFTSLAVHSLVEQGMLRLDDPVSTYLPELARFGGAVTIRNLLQHTSGLPDYYLPPLWNALAAIKPYPTNTDGLTLLSTQGTALFEPGDKFYYLNGGFEALAVVVERISGQRFTDFQQQQIFDRVGMRSAFSLPRPAREATAPYAHSYQAVAGGWQRYEYDPSVYLYGSGDVVSNLDDILRFDRAVFSGQIIGLDLLNQALVPVRLNDGTQPLVPFEGNTTYGLGWFIGSVDSHPYVGHEGIYLGYRAYYAHFMDTELTVIVLLANDYNPFTFHSDIFEPIARVYLDQQGSKSDALASAPRAN